jgi:hypothetical protein
MWQFDESKNNDQDMSGSCQIVVKYYWPLDLPNSAFMGALKMVSLDYETIRLIQILIHFFNLLHLFGFPKDHS